MLVGVGLTPQH